MGKQSARTLWTAKLTGPGAKKKAKEESVVTRSSLICEGFILGIDPSLRGTGLAVIHVKQKNQPVLIYSETIRNKPSLNFSTCLANLSIRTTNLLQKWPIQHVAVEQTIYVQNFQTAQILGAARGALIAAVAIQNCQVFESPPLRIKQAVIGFGRASKEQVSRTLMQMLNLPSALPFDEADALAVALCHAFTYRPLS